MVSVVVTAHNAAGTIAACLTSIAGNREIENGGAEIILVDDRSNDETERHALAMGLKGLHVLRINHYEPGAKTARQIALELGFRKARGEIIMVTDADAIVPSDWISGTVKRFRSADAAAGLITFRGGRKFLSSLQTVDSLFYMRFCRILNRLGVTAGILFGNFAFKRKIYFENGGFGATGFSFIEDLAFARLLRQRNHRITYRDPTIVSVAGCGTWEEWLQRSRRINTAPISGLSTAIGLWMSLLILLPVLSAWGSTIYLLPLAVRYGLGLALIGTAGKGLIRPRLLPVVLIYEPLAIFLGIWVATRFVGKKPIHWGGVLYESKRRR